MKHSRKKKKGKNKVNKIKFSPVCWLSSDDFVFFFWGGEIPVYLSQVSNFFGADSRLLCKTLRNTCSCSRLRSGGVCCVNLVTRCSLRGSVRLVGVEQKTGRVWWKGAAKLWRLLAVLLTFSSRIFVMLTERIWQKAYNQWFLI